MPGMTTMPILQAAPPASSKSPNGTAAADPQNASTASDPTANGASAEATAEAGNAPDSFAEALQRQMAPAGPRSTPAPDYKPSPDPLLLAHPVSGLVTGVSSPTVSVAALVADLSNFVDQLSLHGSAPKPVAADSGTEQDIAMQSALAKLSELLLRALPAGVAESKDVAAVDPAVSLTAAAKADDHSEEIPLDGLAALTPFVQVLQSGEAIKPGAAVADNDQRPASDNTRRLALTPALSAPSAPRRDIGSETAPKAPSDFLPDAAGKSAEFAATQAALAEAAVPKSSQPESVEPEKTFENLLSAAQAVGQHRSAHAATTSNTSLPIQTPVAAHGWDGEVADKLVWMVGRQEQRAELVLNPPQMGRVEVSLSMNDGLTSALFVSANPAVRDALEAALPRLREILADAGVNLGQTQVGADTGNNAGNSSTRNAENRDNSTRGLSESPPGNEILRRLDAPQWIRRGNGLVDIFA